MRFLPSRQPIRDLSPPPSGYPDKAVVDHPGLCVQTHDLFGADCAVPGHFLLLLLLGLPFHAAGRPHGWGGLRFAARLELLRALPVVFENAPVRHRCLEPVEELCGGVGQLCKLGPAHGSRVRHLDVAVPGSRPPVGVRSPLNRTSTNITGEERAEVIGVPNTAPMAGNSVNPKGRSETISWQGSLDSEPSGFPADYSNETDNDNQRADRRQKQQPKNHTTQYGNWLIVGDTS